MFTLNPPVTVAAVFVGSKILQDISAVHSSGLSSFVYFLIYFCNFSLLLPSSPMRAVWPAYRQLNVKVKVKVQVQT